MNATRRCKHEEGAVSCKECIHYRLGTRQMSSYCLECLHAFTRSGICNYRKLERGNRHVEKRDGVLERIATPEGFRP